MKRMGFRNNNGVLLIEMGFLDKEWGSQQDYEVFTQSMGFLF